MITGESITITMITNMTMSMLVILIMLL